MKSTIYIFSFAAVIFFGIACNKNLTVLPENDITPEQITTGSDVEALLGGAYELLQNPGAFGEQFIFVPDLIAAQNQLNFIGTFAGYGDFISQTVGSTNAQAQSIWQNSYDVINTVNTVINKAGLITDGTRDTVIGEAEFIRGTVYFELVNLYGQPYSAGSTATNLGVPLVIQPVFNVDTISNYYVSRATVDQVYTQVLSDLQDAATKLPDENGTNANHYAAEAMLSRVYITMSNYTQAAAMSNDVIQSGQFNLNSSFSAAFNNLAYSSEDIFAILQTVQSNAGTANDGLTTFYDAYSSDFLPASAGGRGDAPVDPSYLDSFPNGDFRQTFFFTGTSLEGGSYTYTQKWMQFYKTIPVIRLAEMYLTRGEANLHLGTVLGATPLSDINTIRARSTAPLLVSAGISDFVSERFREFGFEGDRLWTLKRLKMNVSGLSYNDPKLVLPIPLSEMNVNPNLVQNPGY
jgi:starch-binding outer membrane protein, SusD/RagB family